jgi:hypothetical protein
MKNDGIPYQAIDWSAVPRTEHKGETGTSFWRTLQLAGLRVRIVEYSKGYLADHWCPKGHSSIASKGNSSTSRRTEK